jgi:hypothetical protein
VQCCAHWKDHLGGLRQMLLLVLLVVVVLPKCG